MNVSKHSGSWSMCVLSFWSVKNDDEEFIENMKQLVLTIEIRVASQIKYFQPGCHGWEKCINVNGDWVENNYTFIYIIFNSVQFKFLNRLHASHFREKPYIYEIFVPKRLSGDFRPVTKPNGRRPRKSGLRSVSFDFVTVVRLRKKSVTIWFQ